MIKFLLWNIILYPAKLLLKLMYFLLTLVKYAWFYTPFELELDLLGICNSYHFEFDSKSKELSVKGHSMRHRLLDGKYDSYPTARFAGVTRTSNVKTPRSTVFHLYTTRNTYLTPQGVEIDPERLSLILWVKVGWLNIAVFSTVILIILVYFYMGIFNVYITPNGFNITPFGFLGTVFTLALLYRPDTIAEVLLRPWKIRITWGAFLFVLATLLTFFNLYYPSTRIKYTLVFGDPFNFYFYFNWIYIIYLFWSIFVNSTLKRLMNMGL